MGYNCGKYNRMANVLHNIMWSQPDNFKICIDMPYADKDRKKSYNKAYSHERYLLNRDSILAKNKKWAKNNKDKVNALGRKNNKKWRDKNKEKFKKSVRNTALKRKYGITICEYEELNTRQNGCCAICGIHESKLKDRLCVDHCHYTGKVRGLLCDNCNWGIGNLKDNTIILRKAIKYLSSYKKTERHKEHQIQLSLVV